MSTANEVKADTRSLLLPHHLADLRASGLSEETIRASGVFSETNHIKIAGILNRKTWPKKNGAALVIPFYDDSGAVILQRLKPDRPPTRGGKPGPKYLSPTGAAVRLYVPPTVNGDLVSVDRAILTTEGEKKALCGVQHGFLTVGLTGVDCWHTKKSSSLIPDLERVTWKGRKVYITFDSDAIDNPNIRTNESLLADALTKRGAIVKIVRLPAGPDGEKVGLDDFLVANGADALHKLIAEAEDPEPPEPGEMKADARDIDPATEARGFLDSATRDGVFRLRFYRGGFCYWRHSKYVEIRPSEVRGRLITYLNTGYFKLSTAVTNNVLDQVKALSLLPFHVDQPTWIGDKPGPWPASEVLAARNGLIHLPSLVAHTEHLHKPTPRFFTSSALDYDFDIHAPRPVRWLEFLNQLWPDDPQNIDALQEWFGYSLTPDTSQQKIEMLIGPTNQPNDNAATDREFLWSRGSRLDGEAAKGAAVNLALGYRGLEAATGARAVCPA